MIPDHEHEERAKERVKKTKKEDANPQLKSRHPRGAGTRTSKGTKPSRQATSTRSSKGASSSSRKRTATSMEIMDPDFRPDPATRPKIVSPWLDPMPKTAERYMILRFLNSMHSRHCLPQPVLVNPHCPVLYASSILPSPRLTPRRDCLRLSALIPEASLHSTAVPGPKSGSNPPAGHKPKASSYLLLLYLSIFRGASVRITEPRVGGPVDRQPPEAIHWHPLHATATAKPFGLSINEAPNLKAIRKRSLFRALRRLDRTGNTTYRGHRFTLPLANVSPPRPSQSTSSHQDSRARPRFHVMTWNAGGLSSDRYQQLLLWLQGPGRHLHVVAIQETHWRHDASYKVQGWHAFHFPCSASDKSAGILILVNQRLYPPHKVQLTCLVEGRLVHLRLELNPSIDVLILYQHLNATSAQHKGQGGLIHAQAQRSKVWTKVHQSLSGFPSRNSVLLLGDCNTDLFPDHPHVGPGVRTRLSKQPPDQHEFQQLLKTFSLCALNCWRRAGTQAQTFLPATGLRGTQIDFILTRLSQADGPARTCAPTWLPFVEDSGMRHLPLLGSIPMPSLPKRSQTTSPQLSLASVRQALRTCPDLALSYATKAAQLLKDSTPATISNRLQEAWLQCNPPSSASSAGPGNHTQAIMHLWELRRARRLFLSSRAPDNTDPWPLESDLRSKTKALKKACKQSQQDRIQRILTEAEQAAHKGLTAVYQVVRKLAPKSARKPILFRDSTGAPLSTEQEVESLKDYFRNLYRSDYPEAVPPGHSFPSFTQDELQGALLQLPQGKALPSWVVPSPLWALAATPIAEILHPALQAWCNNMHADMPGDWPTSALCLLNKPSKPPKAPENLRPIALLHPVSKCLATLAAERLRPFVFDLACRFPQFAYVGLRSVEDAIERACAHCAAARTVMEGQKYNLHRRREGHTVGHCKGGLTLSLDLSRAFDCLPREVLHASLRFAQVDAELIDLIPSFSLITRITAFWSNSTLEFAKAAVYLRPCGASLSATLYTCLAVASPWRHSLPSPTTS